MSAWYLILKLLSLFCSAGPKSRLRFNSTPPPAVGGVGGPALSSGSGCCLTKFDPIPQKVQPASSLSPALDLPIDELNSFSRHPLGGWMGTDFSLFFLRVQKWTKKGWKRACPEQIWGKKSFFFSNNWQFFCSFLQFQILGTWFDPARSAVNFLGTKGFWLNKKKGI